MGNRPHPLPLPLKGGELLRIPTAVAPPLPSRGGARGGVCNIISANCKVQQIEQPTLELCFLELLFHRTELIE